MGFEQPVFLAIKLAGENYGHSVFGMSQILKKGVEYHPI